MDENKRRNRRPEHQATHNKKRQSTDEQNEPRGKLGREHSLTDADATTFTVARSVFVHAKFSVKVRLYMCALPSSEYPRRLYPYAARCTDGICAAIILRGYSKKSRLDQELVVHTHDLSINVTPTFSMAHRQDTRTPGHCRSIILRGYSKKSRLDQELVSPRRLSGWRPTRLSIP